MERVYLDSVTQEEQDDFAWLRENRPELMLIATTQPQLRLKFRENNVPVLALGQIAAWAEGTPWFVNLVEGGGLWGYDGIRTMAKQMVEAANTKKDTRDLVPRKGLGCESLDMRRAYRILPCYTGDVSGVCSALYELGGMAVIHDPSGCNSTYNTHDETRWYDQDSMIFISGLSEMDAILGADEKLVAEITETALDLQPKFIALVSSPVPYMNGTDFPALARLIRNRTGIDCFFVPTNGMHDYVAGAGRAFLELARRYAKASGRVIPQSVSILGLTPLDFAAEGTAATLKAKLEEWGY